MTHTKTQNKDMFPHQQQTPDSYLCGPICLMNIFEHFGIQKRSEQILSELHKTKDDYTFTPELARYLRQQGLETLLLSSNASTISRSWKEKTREEIIVLLKAWVTQNTQHDWLIDALFLLFYLQEGGKFSITDLSTKMIDSYLNDGYIFLVSVDTGWLWGQRKIEKEAIFDDLKGRTNAGHFVVLYGIKEENYLVSDPNHGHFKDKSGLYEINKDQLLISILTWSKQALAIKK